MSTCTETKENVKSDYFARQAKKKLQIGGTTKIIWKLGFIDYSPCPLCFNRYELSNHGSNSSKLSQSLTIFFFKVSTQ